MKTKFIENQFTYDGSQLKPHFAYEQYHLLGNSVVSWIGPCEISFEKMVDLEDVLDQSAIRGDLMLHFIIEMFDKSLFAAVAIQRLFAAIVKDELERLFNKAKTENSLDKKKDDNSEEQKAYNQLILERIGDDLFYKQGKLSISIASISAVSTQIHFAVNITNKGTPVKTASLEDLQLDPKQAAIEIMKAFNIEFKSIQEATMKVRPLGIL